jgi:DNA-damage-inducible protein J
MTTLNVRIDEKLKKQAHKTLERLGFDMSGAIKVFLTQVVQDQALPFRPMKDTKKIRIQWDREVAQAIKSGKSYKNVRELLKDLI